ncbi:hypothetical protein, partial [Azohydromonas aeria]|uniref:hypothetical protein n=1 Tax=Azohydromonas aeria TaxID=2590212 RepID=UPI0012FC6BE1
LTGRLLLRPGRAHPGTVERLGPRRAERLAVGRPADGAPALLGALFTLCGHAHGLTARRAVEAARAAPGTVPPPPSAAEARRLQLRTAQEQLRRLLVDAPPALGLEAAPPALLRGCPLWQGIAGSDAALEALPAALGAWLERELLALPAADWLAAWERGGANWLSGWAARACTPAARLLRRLRPSAEEVAVPHRALRLDAADGSALSLSTRLAAEAPLQQAGAVPFATGPWCRAHGRDPGGTDNAWMLFASRLSDLVRLASPDGTGTGARTLDCGAVATGERTGLAWTETARGLLVHRAVLAESGSVAAWRVAAPTDWNFDPQGPAAAALSALPAAGAPGAVQALVLGLDPCLAWEALPCESGAVEAAHA